MKPGIKVAPFKSITFVCSVVCKTLLGGSGSFHIPKIFPFETATDLDRLLFLSSVNTFALVNNTSIFVIIKPSFCCLISFLLRLQDPSLLSWKSSKLSLVRQLNGSYGD